MKDLTYEQQMAEYKEGWLGRTKHHKWFRSHKFKEGGMYSICVGSPPRWGTQGERLFKSPPKNACKNCLRIEKANKKKGR